MSVVTSAILAMAPDDDFPDTLRRVNQFFGPNGFGFRDIEESGYGGNKHMQLSVAIGAFNHLDLDALVEHIRSTVRQDPHWPVQLIVQLEDECGFRIIEVIPQERP